MKTEQSRVTSSAWISLKITLGYTVAGVLWIFLSAFIEFLAVDRTEMLIIIEVFKDLAYVGVVGFLLYRIINKNLGILEKSEKALRESEERYRVTTESAPDAIITIDEESTIIIANRAVTKVFGYEPDELVGKSVTMLMPDRLRDKHLAGVKRYLATGKKSIQWESLRFPALHKNGHEVPVETTYGAFTRNDKFFFTGIIRDVTERVDADREKEYKRMLEQFTQKLETVVEERMMNLITLRLADSVRNPVAVIGWLGKKMLDKGGLPEEAKENLKNIIEEAAGLVTIVEDFQGLLKSKQSAFRYEDINEIVMSLVPVIEKEASYRKVGFTVHLHQEPLKINAQKDLLKMVMFQLAQNALEATPEGGEVLVVTDGDGESVVLSVSDTGYGIPKELHDKIFDPFYSTKKGRFGIGLPLIKQIVSEHLGKIEMVSTEGKGTTFKVTFPSRWIKAAGGEEKTPDT